VLAAAAAIFTRAKLEMSTLASRTLLFAFLVLGFAGVWRLQHSIDTQLATNTSGTRRLGAALWPAAQGLEPRMRRWPPICTDARRAVLRQQARNRSDQPRPSWPLLDVTTTLDPNLIAAYHFGGIVSERLSTAGAGNSQQGIKLLETWDSRESEHWRFFSGSWIYLLL